MNVDKDVKGALQSVIASLSEASQHLADTARILAVGAAPTLTQPKAADPPPVARAAPDMGLAAVPVARSAPVIANSVPLLAPLLNRA
jgi:hypothetical protein